MACLYVCNYLRSYGFFPLNFAQLRTSKITVRAKNIVKETKNHTFKENKLKSKKRIFKYKDFIQNGKNAPQLGMT